MPRLSAAKALALSWLVRTALLLLASLVGWGALLLASAILLSGPGGVVRVFLPREHSFWAWLNAAAAALAVTAVLLVAVGALSRVRTNGNEPPVA